MQMQFALLVHAELELGCVAEICSDFNLPLIMKIYIKEHSHTQTCADIR